MWSRFKTFDPLLFLAPIILMIISVIVIYTLTVDSVGSALFMRQAIYALIGLIGMVAMTFIDYRVFKGLAPWLYLGGLLALVAVKVFGKNDFGAQRWIEIAGFQFQPSEVEKLIVSITIALVLSRSATILSMKRFGLALLLLLIPVGLVLLEPDLGTAIVIGAAGMGAILHARLSRMQKWFLAIGFALIVSVFALSFHGVEPFNSFLKDYQKDRLASFIEPARDQSGSGYNVLQSVIAVGSGGLVGKGLGFGSQSQLNFLPVAHADFIFAGIAEAWGLIGSLGIIALYGILLTRIIVAARIAKDDFGMLICIAILVKLFVEMVVNIGMNMRLMPVTGIPLPFLSYGGTTMITNALCIGVVQSIVLRYKRLTF